jgi:hypothetical protein
MEILAISEKDLTFYSSWASILSLLISIVSLWFVRSIRANIVKFRRKQRMRQLISDIDTIDVDAVPLSPASKTKLDSLKRNVPAGIFARFTERGRIAMEIHKYIAAGDLAALKEAISDWSSYSEEL